jgi:hypothetical protein
MNKLLTVMALHATACFCLGQGYVQFSNGTTTKISTNSVVGGPATGVIAPVPGSYYFALFVGTATQTNVDSSFNGWTFVALGTNTVFSGGGRFWGNNFASSGPAIDSVVVPGVCGGISNFVILGWSANMGSNWHSIQAELEYYQAHGAVTGPGEWIGVSRVGTNSALSCLGYPVNTIIGNGPGPIPGFTLGLYPVQPGLQTTAKKLPNGAFQFGYTANGPSYTVYASTNMVNWTAIGPATQTSPGLFQYTDTNATNYERRYYQFRSP